MGKVNSGPLQLANRQIEVLDKKILQLSNKYNGLLNVPSNDSDFQKALAQLEHFQMPNNYNEISDRIRRDQFSKLPAKWRRIIVFMKMCGYSDAKICSKTLIPMYWISSVLKSSADNTIFKWNLFSFDRKFQLYVTNMQDAYQYFDFKYKNQNELAKKGILTQPIKAYWIELPFGCKYVSHLHGKVHVKSPKSRRMEIS